MLKSSIERFSCFEIIHIFFNQRIVNSKTYRMFELLERTGDQKQPQDESDN